MAILTVANISSRAIVDFCASKGVASDPLLTAAGIRQRLLSESRTESGAIGESIGGFGHCHSGSLSVIPSVLSLQ